MEPMYRFERAMYRNNKTGEITEKPEDPDASYTQLGTVGSQIPMSRAIAWGLAGKEPETKAVKAPPANKAIEMPPATKSAPKKEDEGK